MRNFSRALLFSGLAIVAAVAVWAEVYPVRWDNVTQEAPVATPITGGIQAEALGLGPFTLDAPPECDGTTPGWLTVFDVEDPEVLQSHFLCICVELFDTDDLMTLGFHWVLVGGEENHPDHVCEADPEA